MFGRCYLAFDRFSERLLLQWILNIAFPIRRLYFRFGFDPVKFSEISPFHAISEVEPVPEVHYLLIFFLARL